MFNVQLEPTIIKENLGISRGQMSSVTTSGAFVEVPISKQAKIQQIQVKQITGNGGFTLDLYSDSIHSDDVLSIASDPVVDRLDVGKIDLYFQNTDSTQQSKVYLKITPLIGSNNSFTFAIFYLKL